MCDRGTTFTLVTMLNLVAVRTETNSLTTISADLVSLWVWAPLLPTTDPPIGDVRSRCASR